MRSTEEQQVLCELHEIKQTLNYTIDLIKFREIKDPNESLTIRKACNEFPIAYDKLRRLCKTRKIVHYQDGGLTTPIYLKRKDLEEYFYSDDFKQLVNNYSKPQ